LLRLAAWKDMKLPSGTDAPLLPAAIAPNDVLKDQIAGLAGIKKR
jgi:hypothetical protein